MKLYLKQNKRTINFVFFLKWETEYTTVTRPYVTVQLWPTTSATSSPGSQDTASASNLRTWSMTAANPII